MLMIRDRVIALPTTCRAEIWTVHGSLIHLGEGPQSLRRGIPCVDCKTLAKFAQNSYKTGSRRPLMANSSTLSQTRDTRLTATG